MGGEGAKDVGNYAPVTGFQYGRCQSWVCFCDRGRIAVFYFLFHLLPLSDY